MNREQAYLTKWPVSVLSLFANTINTTEVDL